jgi:ubiquinol-cytochrome c reductase iron-sulfur subunit
VTRRDDIDVAGMTSNERLPESPGSERATLALIALGGLEALGFVVAYALEASTQLLGLALGGSLLAFGAAAVIAGKRVVPQEHAVEERPSFGDSAEQAATAATLEYAGEGVSRRGLITKGAAAAGAAAGAAFIVPLASLGPNTEQIGETPWRRGTRVVGDEGSQLGPGDVEVGTFATAFPEGADKRELGSAILLIKLPPEDLDLPPERAGWAPHGVLAFSKVCTHAGCAINLYRYPLYAPTSPGPAFVCPCHYSTFDPTRGGKVIFGPAGRDLPQLPLELDSAGKLVAAGPFPEGIGPAYWGVRPE